MTITETKQRIRQLGLTCRYDSATGEFRVNLLPQDGGNEDTAYYTDDRQDAVDTAQAMSVGLPQYLLGACFAPTCGDQK